jgi:uncharacterized protein YidB (DUF937 family)
MTLLQTAAQLFLSRLDGASQGLDEAKVADGLSSLLPTAGGDLDVQALVGQFTGAGGGIAQLAQSWLGNGGNLAISREQIEAVLGGGAIGAFAQRLGLDGERATSGLAAMLPELIDRISTDGELRSDVLSAVGRGILGKLF